MSSTLNVAENGYVRNYVYSLIFFSVLGASLAIFSYSPRDPSAFSTIVTQAGKVEIHNLFGSGGAWFADWMIELFGIGAPILGILFMTWTLASFKHQLTSSQLLLRILGIPHFLICFLGLISTFLGIVVFRGNELFAGGILGSKMSSMIIATFGEIGTIFIFSFGILASLPLCLGISPVGMLVGLLGFSSFKRAKNAARVLKNSDIEDFNNNTPEPAPINYKCSSPIHAPYSEPLLQKPIQSPTLKTTLSSANTDISDSQKTVTAEIFSDLTTLLKERSTKASAGNLQEAGRLQQEALTLEEKLATFGVLGKVLQSQAGPVVNIHEFEPAPGIKVSRVMSLQDDLALALKAQSVLMAPQSGKSTIGIEIPAANREIVPLKEIMASKEFAEHQAILPMALGKTVDGKPLIVDLTAMPHLLVAGSTGSGKSVGINVMLLSLLMHNTPKQLRCILVDPKMLELSTYDGIGHLLMPVVTEPQKAAGALKWVIDEMERRYRLMKEVQVRSVISYNKYAEKTPDAEYLPFIVVVVDELCDLMMTAPRDIEDSIQRLAQKSRAAGIHLILATQRPSVDVLTGVIKANLPCRLSYQVASKHDSRTIIEKIGAEKLLGKGDMLFLAPGTNRLMRAHSAYVDDSEISLIANKIRHLFPANVDKNVVDRVDRAAVELSSGGKERQSDKIDVSITESLEIDENTLYEKALAFAQDSGSVSTSSIQRHFRIGYNRAARIMDRMVTEGVVGASEAAGKPRPVLLANDN